MERLARFRWVAFPVGLFVISRAALLLFSKISLSLIPSLYEGEHARSFLKRFPSIDGLCRWDCGFFEMIAARGYSEIGATNFFPLFPLLGRAVHEVTGAPMVVSLIIVANLAALASYVVLFWLFRQLESDEVARWALVVFVFYPFAFFQASAYPESLMVLFSALAIALAIRGRHLWAGVALGFGVLARHLTLLAGAGLVVAQVRQRGWNPRRLLLHPDVLGLVIPWLFLGAYCAYQYVRFGDPFGFWTVRKNWGEYAYWGVYQLASATRVDIYVKGMYAYLPFAVATTIASAALLTKRRWLEMAGFAIALLVVLWSVGMYGLGRYTASVWPAALPAGAWLVKRPALQGPVVGVLALFQGLFFYLVAHQFPLL